jgi:hypothetical protein
VEEKVVSSTGWYYHHRGRKRLYPPLAGITAWREEEVMSSTGWYNCQGEEGSNILHWMV